MRLFGALRGRPGMWGCFAGFTRKTPPHLPLATRNPKDSKMIYLQTLEPRGKMIL